MKITKKKKRKELIRGSDEFISTIDIVINYITAHYKVFCYAGVVVFLMVLVILGIRSYKEKSINRVLRTESNLNKTFFNLLYTDQSKDKKQKMNQLVSQYETLFQESRTSVNRHTISLTLANLYYETGQYDKSIETYHKLINFAPKKSWLIAVAYLGLGFCYERADKCTSALEYYQKAETEESFPARYDAQMGKARCYEKRGNFTKAEEIYHSIIETNPGHIWLKEAIVRKERLPTSEKS